MRTWPANCCSSCSMSGSTARQGPHQGAQKSMRTTPWNCSTRSRKVASVKVSRDMVSPVQKKTQLCAPAQTHLCWCEVSFPQSKYPYFIVILPYWNEVINRAEHGKELTILL